MTSQLGIPKGAATAINDMLDNCAKMKPGDNVLILSELEDLYNKDWAVDETAVAWIQQAVMMKGGNATILWIDEPPVAHKWRFSPVVKGAMQGCDILINHSLNLVTEEMSEFRVFINENKIRMVRNFASTAPLLCSYWAQTPYELVCEIRRQASMLFQDGLPYVLTDRNGTHLEGNIVGGRGRPYDSSIVPYVSTREETGFYLPWPEWVHPPVNVSNTNGVFIFDCMLSWWSRYIGISPYFQDPIAITVENNRMVKIEGKKEAEALKAFLTDMSGRIGDTVWDFPVFHHGVHPQAIVGLQQCPNINLRRTIEHSHSSNLHFHIGQSFTTPQSAYPYWYHCTGDIRHPTLKIGDTYSLIDGHLTALDHPEVKAVADKYPGRPGVDPMPVSF